MTEQLLISVLMTSYNRAAFIAEAIESVLLSSYSNFELIIVDDCSTDDTLSIARSYQSKDERIKVYLNEKNIGDYPNRNKAVSYARGEYVMFVDSDDKIFPDGIERCVKAMQSNSEASFGMYWPHEADAPFIMNAEEAIVRHFFRQPFLMIGPGGTIIRRSFLESINKYPEKYGPANDMYFNLKAACKSAVLLLPFNFIYYRRHAGQQINDKYSYMINNYRYLRDALKELPLPLDHVQLEWVSKKNKRRFAVNIIKYFFTTFKIKETRQAVKQAEFGYREFFTGIFH